VSVRRASQRVFLNKLHPHVIGHVTSDGSIPQYRSISWAAIGALMLGLASMLAIFNPLLLAIAVAAVGLAVFALRQIGAQPEILSGRRLALTGLFLSVFLVVFVPARLSMRSWVLQRRGQQLAEAFLGLLQAGKTFEAHQLSNLKYRSQRPSEMADMNIDPNKLNAEDFRGFEQTQTIRDIERIDHKFDFHWEAAEPSRTYSQADVFVLRYRLVPDAAAGKKPFPVWITISRERDRRSGIPIWRIIDIQHVFKEKR
jgi:hypothetical protein